MKQVITSLAVLFLAAPVAFAADQTWTGKISDSMCGVSHKAMEHGDKKMTDRSCTEACVKGGAKYVFTSKGKTYTIANQNDPDLATHAGHTVMLTGNMKGQDITVSKIMMAGKNKK
jgi:hypothetical protein